MTDPIWNRKHSAISVKVLEFSDIRLVLKDLRPNHLMNNV